MQHKNIDYTLFFAVICLIIFGMIMISSVSVYGSFRVTDIMAKAGRIEEAYNYFYVLRNIAHIFISLIVLAVVAKIHYSFFEKCAKYIFGIILCMLGFVLIVGITLGGAKGWIDIPGLPFTIQPTEFLKLGLIIYLAAFFKKFKNYIPSLSDGFIPYLIIIGICVLLVGLQPDFGTIMVILPLSAFIYFYAGANIKHLIITALLGSFLVGSVYSLGEYDKTTGQNLNNLGYITQRIDNFLADNKEAIKNKTINYQTEQALIAIGSGGFTGLGFGKSIQKFGYLPEVQGDFIFSVIVEELGFIGGLGLLCIYLFIGYRGWYIANHVNDLFAKYSALGISCWILLQACINIGVNLNIVPLTGITLPFVSYGGSSLLALCIGLGILLNISRYVEVKNSFSRKQRKVFMF
ncbi:putative lipid II flippase FtsW [Candidatus Gracilibacteria bacterium]|nr:putative lipid II flippase FtsW [Candidatus Gracilibacteria bacterium]